MSNYHAGMLMPKWGKYERALFEIHLLFDCHPALDGKNTLVVELVLYEATLGMYTHRN